MQYFALLISGERDLTPDEGAAEMAAYQAFHAKAASAIRGGDALLPAATAVRITGGPDAPVVTDGPFAEGAEVAGGYYVFEAENLDEALALARDIPAAKRGGVEIWPMAGPGLQPQPTQGATWLALLLEPPDRPRPARRSGRRWPPSTRSSGPRRVNTSRAVPACTHRRRQPPYGCATARSSSLTGHTRRAPKSPTASMSSPPPTATRPSRSPR
jgi:hypothetical protein